MKHSHTGLAVAATAALLSAGCASGPGVDGTAPPTAPATGNAISRAQLFTSLEELVDASGKIVAVDIIDTDVVFDIDVATPFTLAEARVVGELKPDGLGSALEPGTTTGPDSTGDTIVVRQTGDEYSPGLIHTPEFLRPSEQYLLFLVPSGLAGEAASQYYITGVSSGMFRPSAHANSPKELEAMTFTHVGPYDGDTLPASFTVADLP